MSEEDFVALFLDDNPNRAALAYQRFPEKIRDRTIWTQTSEDAIGVLKDYAPRLRYVFLDHDLGGETYVHSGREDCGMEVVRYLEKQDPSMYKDCKFRVHTWNVDAGYKMTDRLKKVGYTVDYVPFGM